MKSLVLASGSPRRKELLGRLIKEFEIITDDSAEVVVLGELPQDTVRRLAMQKAHNVKDKVDKSCIILAADTVVSIDDKILGKPCDEEEAFLMLENLSGRYHQVYTGFAIIDTETGDEVSDFECTKVKFKELTKDEILAYIRSGEPMDKAGAYGIQELGALFIEGIEGDYFNVVGLPLCKLGKILKERFSFELLGK